MVLRTFQFMFTRLESPNTAINVNKNKTPAAANKTEMLRLFCCLPVTFYKKAASSVSSEERNHRAVKRSSPQTTSLTWFSVCTSMHVTTVTAALLLLNVS